MSLESIEKQLVLYDDKWHRDLMVINRSDVVKLFAVAKAAKLLYQEHEIEGQSAREFRDLGVALRRLEE